MPEAPVTERRPRLLDLFCGAGGAAMGYYRAAFQVIVLDIQPQAVVECLYGKIRRQVMRRLRKGSPCPDTPWQATQPTMPSLRCQAPREHSTRQLGKQGGASALEGRDSCRRQWLQKCCGAT